MNVHTHVYSTSQDQLENIGSRIDMQNHAGSSTWP